jgi:hypothetical protein
LTKVQHRANHSAWRCQHISKHGGENDPERWSQRPRHAHGFPADGTTWQQIDWFRRQFLKLADKASRTKERGDFLRLAFMATLKGESAFAADEMEAQAREQLERVQQKLEEGRARREMPLPQLDEEAEAILRHF